MNRAIRAQVATELIVPVVLGLASPVFGTIGKIWGKQPVTHIHNHIEKPTVEWDQKRDGHIELIPLRTDLAPVPEVSE